MRGMKVVALVLVAVVVFSVPAMATSSVGVKLWLANWEAVSTESGEGNSWDLGDEMMYMLQYSYVIPDTPMAFTVQGGMGSGWRGEGDTQDHSRTDFLMNISRRLGKNFHAGLGYHYQAQENKNSGWEGTYHGAEALAGAVLPLGDAGLSVMVTGMYIPLLFWDSDSGPDGTNDGETYAYGFDIGLVQKLSNWKIAVGYREQDIEGDRGKAEATTYITDDNFGGFYTSASIVW